MAWVFSRGVPGARLLPFAQNETPTLEDAAAEDSTTSCSTAAGVGAQKQLDVRSTFDLHLRPQIAAQLGEIDGEAGVE